MSLPWAVDDGATSFMELAFILKHNGLQLVDVPQTPESFATLIKKTVSTSFCVNKQLGLQTQILVPGTLRTTYLSND